MSAKQLIQRLSAGSTILPASFADVADEEARWKPDDGGWSLVEIVNHLADEEVEDFRTRLDLTLHHPEQEWPPIDPEGWSKTRKYQQRDLNESIERFASARRASAGWLRSLDHPDWTVVHTHPHLGSISAGDLLASWVAHDMLHLRQIAKRRYQYAQVIAEPFSGRYAGAW